MVQRKTSTLLDTFWKYRVVLEDLKHHETSTWKRLEHEARQKLLPTPGRAKHDGIAPQAARTSSNRPESEDHFHHLVHSISTCVQYFICLFFTRCCSRLPSTTCPTFHSSKNVRLNKLSTWSALDSGSRRIAIKGNMQYRSIWQVSLTVTFVFEQQQVYHWTKAKKNAKSYQRCTSAFGFGLASPRCMHTGNDTYTFRYSIENYQSSISRIEIRLSIQ